MLDPAIFLAAMGIILLEMSEAAAIALALYSEEGPKAFLYVGLGATIILLITFSVGEVIALLPFVIIELIAGSLLLYFGLRLVKSARKAVLRSRSKSLPKKEGLGKGLFYTGFSAGAIEAFEAAIVLVALIPINYSSALFGVLAGLAVVILAAAVLKNQIRKIKQAIMKVAVSSLLLAFSVFWFSEVFINISDLILFPLFALFFTCVYIFAHRK